MAIDRNAWWMKPEVFEEMRQNFTTAFHHNGPTMNLPDMSVMLCEFKASHEALRAENAALRAQIEGVNGTLTSARVEVDNIITTAQGIRKRSTSPKRQKYGLGMAEAAKAIRSALITPPNDIGGE